jgi:hypothetical protein
VEIALSVLEKKEFFLLQTCVLREFLVVVKTCTLIFGQKLVEILLSILGKRKISVLNFNLDGFRQGVNWA